jgi:hypothetical protein
MDFLDAISNSGLTGYMSFFLVLLGVAVLALWQPFIEMDPAEPRLLKPTIPYIGHAIGFLRYQTKYLTILQWVLVLRNISLPLTDD